MAGNVTCQRRSSAESFRKPFAVTCRCYTCHGCGEHRTNQRCGGLHFHTPAHTSSLKHDVAVTHTRFRATGADFEKSGPDGNDISLTNVPNTRIRFR